MRLSTQVSVIQFEEESMRAIKCFLIVISAVGFVSLFADVRADEEKIPLDKLPKPVVEAVKKRFPKAEMIEAAKETADGKTEYEVSIKDGGKKIDIMLAPDGTITVIEKEIAARDLPKAVQATLDKKYPKATYKKTEEVIKVKEGKETLDFYEVLLATADKKEVEVKVSADGKIKE